MEPKLVTGNATLDHYLTILGIVTTLSSAAATFVNTRLRSAIDAKEEVPKFFLYLALVVNYAAFNIDKCGQVSRLLRGAPATMLVVHSAPEKTDA